jgi:hypothetical protein
MAKILVADDDEGTLSLARRRMAGYRVEITDHGSRVVPLVKAFLRICRRLTSSC